MVHGPLHTGPGASIKVDAVVLGLLHTDDGEVDAVVLCRRHLKVDSTSV